MCTQSECATPGVYVCVCVSKVSVLFRHTLCVRVSANAKRQQMPTSSSSYAYVCGERAGCCWCKNVVYTILLCALHHVYSPNVRHKHSCTWDTETHKPMHARNSSTSPTIRQQKQHCHHKARLFILNYFACTGVGRCGNCAHVRTSRYVLFCRTEKACACVCSVIEDTWIRDSASWNTNILEAKLR